MNFRYLVITCISSWKKVCVALHLNKLESPPPPKKKTQKSFVPRLVEIGLVILEKMMKMWNVYNDDGERTNCDQKNSLGPSAHNYLPLKKVCMALHRNKLESPQPKDALCQVLLKLVRWFWRRRWKCQKFSDWQTNGQTDDGLPSEKLTWAFSSGDLTPNRTLFYESQSVRIGFYIT